LREPAARWPEGFVQVKRAPEIAETEHKTSAIEIRLDGGTGQAGDGPGSAQWPFVSFPLVPGRPAQGASLGPGRIRPLVQAAGGRNVQAAAVRRFAAFGGAAGQRDEAQRKAEQLELEKRRIEVHKQWIEIEKLRLEVELLRYKKWYYGPRADKLRQPCDSAQLLPRRRTTAVAAIDLASFHKAHWHGLMA
jgi:hypothetical protein